MEFDENGKAIYFHPDCCWNKTKDQHQEKIDLSRAPCDDCIIRPFQYPGAVYLPSCAFMNNLFEILEDTGHPIKLKLSCEKENVNLYYDDFKTEFNDFTKDLPKYVLCKENDQLLLFNEANENERYFFNNERDLEHFLNLNKLFRIQIVGVEAEENLLISRLNINWYIRIHTFKEFLDEIELF